MVWLVQYPSRQSGQKQTFWGKNEREKAHMYDIPPKYSFSF